MLKPPMGPALVAVVAAWGCYAPTIGTGSPCDLDRGSCPRGQHCIATDRGGFCLAVDAIPDAGGADTAARPMTYAEVVLADDPIGYWRLGDRTPTAIDASGKGTDAPYGSGIVQGVPGAIVNDADTAVEFGGSIGAIPIGSGFDFAGTAAFSIEAWVKPTLFDDVFRHVFTRQRRTTPRQGYALLLQRDDGIKFERFVDDADVIVSFLTTPSASAFTHVVATYDGAFLRLYVNGQQVDQRLENRPQPAFTDSAVIGAANLAESFFAGSIDEVAVYAAALEAARVEAHYIAGTVPATDALTARHRQ